ncbi:MAG: acyltransferase family protein [Candidatus Dormibacteraceae bacterium]
MKSSAPLAGRSLWTKLRARAWWPESGAVSPVPALDGLRAIAVLLVLAFHSWYKVPGYLAAGQPESSNPLDAGHTGVHLFFVLSAFLLFQPYARWLFGLQGRPSALLFFRRRALRVGPAYWCCMFFILMAGSLGIRRLADVGLHTVFLQNLYGPSTYSLDGVFYTMAIEVQFYLTLPVLGWFCMQLVRRARIQPALAIGICAASMFLIALVDKALSATSLTTVPTVGTALLTFSSLPYWYSVFAMGIVASTIYVYLTTRGSARFPNLAAAGSATFAVGLSLWLALVFVPALAQTPAPLMGVAYASILLGVVFGSMRIRAIFEWRPLRFVGLISYSLYLWHLGVLKVFDRFLVHLPLTEHVAARFLLLLTFGVAFAYLSYQLTERPFMNARRKAHDQPGEQRATARSETVGAASLAST